MGLTDLFIILVLAVAITTIVTKIIDKIILQKLINNSGDVFELSRIAYKNDIADNAIHIILAILWFICNYFLGEVVYPGTITFEDYFTFVLGCAVLNFNFLRFLTRDLKKSREDMTDYYLDISKSGFNSYTGKIRKDDFFATIFVVVAGFAIIYLLAPYALLITSIVKTIRLIRSSVRLYKISDHTTPVPKNRSVKTKKADEDSSISKNYYNASTNPSKNVPQEENTCNAFTKISGDIIKKITNDKKYSNIKLNWNNSSQVECEIIDVHYYVYNGSPAIYALATPLTEKNPYVPYAFMIGGNSESTYGLIMCDEAERNMVVLDYNENLHKESKSFDYISESTFKMLVNSTQDNVEYNIKWNDGKIRSTKKEKVLFIDEKYGDFLFIIVSTGEHLASDQDVMHGLFMICAGNNNYHILECTDEFLVEKARDEYLRLESLNCLEGETNSKEESPIVNKPNHITNMAFEQFNNTNMTFEQFQKTAKKVAICFIAFSVIILIVYIVFILLLI